MSPFLWIEFTFTTLSSICFVSGNNWIFLITSIPDITFPKAAKPRPSGFRLPE
jgi:hypothetical protein